MVLLGADSWPSYSPRATCDVANDRDTESDTFLGAAVLNATRELILLVAGSATRVAANTRSLEWVRRALVNMETDMVWWFGEEHYCQKKKKDATYTITWYHRALCKFVDVCVIMPELRRQTRLVSTNLKGRRVEGIFVHDAWRFFYPLSWSFNCTAKFDNITWNDSNDWIRLGEIVIFHLASEVFLQRILFLTYIYNANIAALQTNPEDRGIIVCSQRHNYTVLEPDVCSDLFIFP